MTPETGLRGADGPVDRRLRGRRRLDAPDRLLEGQHRRQRHRRRRAADRGRCGARRSRCRSEPNVALTFFGDGATNIGTFHEALNMAAVWKAPVVFIITNNLYGEYSPSATTTPHGRPGPAGRSVRHARHRRRRPGRRRRQRDRQRGARAGTRAASGPSLLEMKTYRYRGHSRSDPAKYRPGRRARALEGARPDRPSWARELAAEGILSADEQDAIRDRDPGRHRCRRRASRRAAPYPTLEETRPYVYAD